MSMVIPFPASKRQEAPAINTASVSESPYLEQILQLTEELQHVNEIIGNRAEELIERAEHQPEVLKECWEEIISLAESLQAKLLLVSQISRTYLQVSNYNQTVSIADC